MDLRRHRQRVASISGLFDPVAESEAIFTAFPTPATADEQGHIDRFVRALLNASVWTKFSLLYVVGATSSPSDNGLVNWVSPGTFDLTVGAAGGTFTAYRGYAGNGTNAFLTTGWDPSNNGGAVYQQDDAHAGAYTRSSSASGNPEFATGTATAVGIRAGPSVGSARINNGTAHTFTTSIAVPKHCVGVRRESTTVYGFQDGATAGSTAIASAALSTADLAIGRYNTTGWSNGEVFAAHVGAQLSDADVLAIYNALYTLAVAVGADT